MKALLLISALLIATSAQALTRNIDCRDSSGDEFIANVYTSDSNGYATADIKTTVAEYQNDFNLPASDGQYYTVTAQAGDTYNSFSWNDNYSPSMLKFILNIPTATIMNGDPASGDFYVGNAQTGDWSERGVQLNCSQIGTSP